MGLFYGPEQATRFQADGSPLLRTTLGHTDRQKKFFKNYIFGDKITEDTHTKMVSLSQQKGIQNT